MLAYDRHTQQPCSRCHWCRLLSIKWQHSPSCFADFQCQFLTNRMKNWVKSAVYSCFFNEYSIHISRACDALCVCVCVCVCVCIALKGISLKFALCVFWLLWLFCVQTATLNTQCQSPSPVETRMVPCNTRMSGRSIPHFLLTSAGWKITE